MLILRLWNYIRGYVIILVEGYFLEKFINICIHRQIYLWDVKRLKNNRMLLKISINGFRHLRPVAKKTGCRVRIQAKKGVPFLAYRYKRRKAFLVGAFVFVFALCLLTSFVWSVEVSGNKRIDTRLILDNLEELGLKPGVLKYGIDATYLANSMTIKIGDIAWIGIAISGTRAKIEVVERKPAPRQIPKDKPCNIIAAKAGVIKRITTKTGAALVNEGDTVIKGQILVSGEIKNSADEKEPPRYVHAMSGIIARTWYERDMPVNMVNVERRRTGNQKERFAIGIFKKLLYINGNESPYKDFEKVTINHRLSLGGDRELPFEYVTDRYYEIEAVQKNLTMDEAKEAAVDRAMEEITAEIGENAEIANRNVRFIGQQDGSLIANVVVECLEEIGSEVEIKK